MRADKAREGIMKRSTAVLLACVFVTGIAIPAQAKPDKHSERFANTIPVEPMLHSRSDAVKAAAQVPGAAGVLLEALRWRGRTARQIGLTSKLMAYVMPPNYVLQDMAAAARASALK